MTFPFRVLDENDTFHLGTFDAVRGNFAATSGRRNPFHSLVEHGRRERPFSELMGAVS